MRKYVLPAILLLACFGGSCTRSGPSTPRAIVGAKLVDGTGKPAIEYSVVVIAKGKIKAVGTQQDVPVPKESEIVGGLNSTIEPLEGGTIEIGKPANLKVSGVLNRTMRNGEWVN